MDLENNLEKKPIRKIEKTVKIKVKLPHVNKKPLERTRIFVQTPFSHVKFGAKKFHAAKPLAFFRSTSCFGVTKITTQI